MNSAHPQPQSSHTFLPKEAMGGVLLMLAAAAALAIANSPLSADYFATLDHHVAGLSIVHWINDALMALFFLLVGLEIKREIVQGELASWPQRILPGVAALGGMIAPALIYVAINSGSPEALRGWAIPTATDIAFALAILSLAGSRLPVALKVFLTALAIIDDLGAILIIALFYTADVSIGWLAASGLVIAGLVALNRAGVTRLMPYLVGGLLLWLFVYRSGVHSTLAGVALALTIPGARTNSPLETLEHRLSPWVAFLVLPLFGLANAGVTLDAGDWAAMLSTVPLGIATGLFVGKQVGVFLTTMLAFKLKWAEPPEGTAAAHVYGVSLLCGIGFTMSLFIGLLAFPDDPGMQNAVKLGVLAGSLLSGLAGAAVLHVSTRGGAMATRSKGDETRR